MAYRPKQGDIVHVVFWDHSECFEDAMQFEVFGKIARITPKAYIIGTWQYYDPLQRAADKNPESNENHFCIVKKAVDSIRQLKPGK
jgi:hypothetical protein